MRVLVVEDNVVLASTIEEGLSDYFEVSCCGNGEEAVYFIEKGIYDVIVLDIMLPDISGIDVLKDVRARHVKTPIIMLTAKETLDDKVGAFSLGANDYITKPFYMEELVARIYAILRTSGSISEENVVSFKELKLDLDTREVFIGCEKVDLVNKEFNILEYFIINKDLVLMKEQIYDRIWGIESDIPLEIVEVHISNLRKKLSKYGYNKYIKTKRGIGYTFDDK